MKQSLFETEAQKQSGTHFSLKFIRDFETNKIVLLGCLKSQELLD